MSKFIRLTTKNQNKVMINVGDISYIIEHKEGGSSVAIKGSDEYLIVQESGQAVRNRLKELECVIS